MLQRSTTRARGGLQRSGTRRAPNGPAVAKQKKTYKDVTQGIKQLFPKPDKTDVEPDIDIVFVPGLGAHPEDSWKHEKSQFSWAADENGLIRDFPTARILLYTYESAWFGQLKVKQFLGNIAEGLLQAVLTERKDCERRPLVFIGHSMGGLVISKAVTMAEWEADRFPKMIEATCACIFFGTPFGGAHVASFASILSRALEKLDKASQSKLVEMMKPGDESLRELKQKFANVAGKLNNRIDIYCFYEEQPTNFAKNVGLPELAGALVPKQFAEFVSRDSATIDNANEMGLACNHRDLVKFEGPRDSRWRQVRGPLKTTISGAYQAVKGRLNSTRNIDPELILGINDALEGPSAAKMRARLKKKFPDPSWISQVQDFKHWLDVDSVRDVQETPHRGGCIWIRGPEGRGKTSAAISALESIEGLSSTDARIDTDAVTMAYYFCSPVEDYCTAEDILKSLVRQLISQHQVLATYARPFVKRGRMDKDDSYKRQAQVTVENLWQAILDMLDDDFIGRNVYFVLTNLHVLPEDSPSTMKLMDLLYHEIQNINNRRKRCTVRWFITSRSTYRIGKALGSDAVRLVDLNDEQKYGNRVQSELRKHARREIEKLGVEKEYNRALTYFASSFVGKRAQNRQWIDITCVRLKQLPKTESDLKVRQLLDTIPKDLKILLDRAWRHIFDSNEADAENIKEILRTLVLTYEPPNEWDMVVLSGLSLPGDDLVGDGGTVDGNEDDDYEREEKLKGELNRLIAKCQPLLYINRTSSTSGTVWFMDAVVKSHLLEHSEALLGRSEEEMKLQHGVLALRSFLHIKEYFDYPDTDAGSNQDEEESPAGSRRGSVSQKDDNDDETESNSSKGDKTEAFVPNEACSCEQCQKATAAAPPANGEWDDDNSSWDEDEDEEEEPDYMVKYWLRHASKANYEFAEDLSQGLGSDFWQPGSRIRRRWLTEYANITNAFEDLGYTESGSVTGMHVAAALGYRELVEGLIQQQQGEEVHIRDFRGNTPLHLASWFGRTKIVEELLLNNAKVDDGVEIGNATPLHMAAFNSHVEVMQKLLNRGANPEARSSSTGPVINAAISSGNPKAVQLLVDLNVAMYTDNDDQWSPLETAAFLSDVEMLKYLIENCSQKLPRVAYSEALVRAAEAGKMDNFKLLFAYQHEQEFLQQALDGAAEGANWVIVNELLEYGHRLKCDTAFYEAATGISELTPLLREIWQYSLNNWPISPETINRSLYDATDREKTETVKLLLQTFQASPNATGEEYGNALTASAFDGTRHILELLLDAGAIINSADGWALQAAATQGHYEIVELLLQKGAKVNACTENDNFPAGTAIQGACESGHEDIVGLLLEYGADPNLGRGDDSPPIVAATSGGEAEIVEKLLAAKANVNVTGGWDDAPPIMYAIENLPQESLQLLLNAGADINMTNDEGDTALIRAAEEDEVDATLFLLNNGADIMHRNHENHNALQAATQVGAHLTTDILVHRVSELLIALSDAMKQGNTAVATVVRSGLANTNQGLSWDDKASDNSSIQGERLDVGTLNYDDDDSPPAVQARQDSPPLRPRPDDRMGEQGASAGYLPPCDYSSAHDRASPSGSFQFANPPGLGPSFYPSEQPPSQNTSSFTAHQQTTRTDQQPALPPRQQPYQGPGAPRQASQQWASQAATLMPQSPPTPEQQSSQTPVKRKPAPEPGYRQSSSTPDSFRASEPSTFDPSRPSSIPPTHTAPVSSPQYRDSTRPNYDPPLPLRPGPNYPPQQAQRPAMAPYQYQQSQSSPAVVQYQDPGGRPQDPYRYNTGGYPVGTAPPPPPQQQYSMPPPPPQQYQQQQPPTRPPQAAPYGSWQNMGQSGPQHPGYSYDGSGWS